MLSLSFGSWTQFQGVCVWRLLHTNKQFSGTSWVSYNSTQFWRYYWALRDWRPACGSFCLELLAPIGWDRVQNCRAETLLIDQGIWRRRSCALKHLLSKGRWAGFSWDVKEEGSPHHRSGWGHVGYAQILPSCTWPLSFVSFWAGRPVTISDCSGLDSFCSFVIWPCSALAPISKYKLCLKTTH